VKTALKGLSSKRLSNQQAVSQLKTCSIAGFTCPFVGFFLAYGWFGIAVLLVGVAFSTRALMLTKHKGNASNPMRAGYTALAIVGLLFGLGGVALILQAELALHQFCRAGFCD